LLDALRKLLEVVKGDIELKIYQVLEDMEVFWEMKLISQEALLYLLEKELRVVAVSRTLSLLAA